jgi:hypothetical protein
MWWRGEILAAMKMPFGKFRHWPLPNVPTDYLLWLEENIQLREPLRTAVRRELELREWDPEPCAVAKGVTLTIAPDDVPLTQDLVNAGYGSLALRLHPDRGGSNEGMKRLNALAEQLRSQLEANEVGAWPSRSIRSLRWGQVQRWRQDFQGGTKGEVTAWRWK